ncbi:Carnosine N-methyltransferase, partial [Lasiodiplodia hormozganensis]
MAYKTQHKKSIGKSRAIADVNKWRKAYKKIPRKQRAFIEANIHYSKKLNTIEHLIDTNAQLTHAIVDNALAFYNISQRELDDFIAETKDRDTAADAASSKTHVQQALKHFVRDWSAEGRHERDPTFPCILHALQEEFFPKENDASNVTIPTEPIRVLVPGAGLGRLAHEIAALGHFEVTTNEWSAYTNVAYRFLTTLLHPSSSPPQSPTTITFHPFIDWLSHQRTTTSLTRPITIPDFPPPVSPPHPPSPPPSSQSQVLLIEADFATLTGTYDALITLFFIDTAANLLAYLHSIHALLRPGGVWVN